jgi:hypothetical protein
VFERAFQTVITIKPFLGVFIFHEK